MKAIAMMLAAMLALPQAALAGARQDATVTMPDDPKARQSQEAWGYSDAVLAGDTAYLSGVVATMRDGEATADAAYTRAFERIADRLSKIGCSWDDVVDITSFHTDLSAQLPVMIAVKRNYVHAPFPAWTAIGVTRLVPDRGITEIKVVAKSCARIAPKS